MNISKRFIYSIWYRQSYLLLITCSWTAWYNLGRIYSTGKYVKRDINKAIYQESPEAQFKLGVIFQKRQFINRDITKAIYYYTHVANKNIPHAQYNLGVIYFSIEKVTLAIHYYIKKNNVIRECLIWGKWRIVEMGITWRADDWKSMWILYAWFLKQNWNICYMIRIWLAVNCNSLLSNQNHSRLESFIKKDNFSIVISKKQLIITQAWCK